MTERNTPWAPGTPCWVDLLTPDLAAAQAFYAALFGWELTDMGEEAGHYTMATVGGRNVCALTPQQPEQAGHQAVWTTYLATTDAGLTSTKIVDAGGTVFIEALKVGDAGVMGLAADVTGAVFGTWQAGTHSGFQLANEPSSVTWNEQLSRDVPRAQAFYADVFGLTYTDIGDGGFEYATAEVDGVTVGGVGALPDGVPADVPAHWRTYFAVEDADASVAKAVELGATVIRPASDMMYGRWADLADPTGAFFSVIKSADPAEAQG